MGANLALTYILTTWIVTAQAQSNGFPGLNTFCQRFPNNPNCPGSGSSSSSSSSNSKPVDPRALGLPPPPSQGGASSQPAPSSNNDPCSSWKLTYDTYCVGSKFQKEYQSSCSQYQQTCLGGGASGGGLQSAGGPQPQPTSQGSSAGSTWAALTEKAQAEQAQQALAAAQNGQANCGQYQDNYNVWCGGAKQINALYCNTLGRVCQQQAAQTASGQQAGFGPFGNSNGLPTGGAGSTRPLTIGNNFGVGPFVGLGKTLGINPLQGVGSSQGVNVPIAGIGVQSSRGVDWGGLPGVAQLGAALGRRRRRWAIPVAVDNFGNVVYFIR